MECPDTRYFQKNIQIRDFQNSRGKAFLFFLSGGKGGEGDDWTGTGCVEVTQVMEQQGGEGGGDMDMAPVVMAAGPPHRRRIVKLEESVVNKIAAGEVVQRPFNALKELLENSIDAGSTKVSVTVRDGGNTMIRVQDDGCGIHEGDLPLLCERHATSKLETFEDLRTVQTLGFRGEALCSVSYVAHLTVTTMREGDAHATRTVFRDSKIEDGPKPCAGLVGTTVTVEDLFYNMPIRRKALRSPSEELAKVIEVVGRYAVYHDGVGVSLKRHGNARPDVSTSASDTKQQKIRMVFGSQVGSNLLEFKASAVPDECDGEGMSFQAKGYASSANYNSGKRTVLVLFINGRLVECSPLKRCLETVYASVLAKGSRPFFYVELTIPHEQVDVNVHPTKKEVNFLHQDDLIERLREAVENAVFTSNDHRTYYKQTTLQVPGAHNSSILGSEDPAGARKRGRQEGDQKDPRGREATTRRDRAGGDYKLVRTDAHEKKLETFFFSQDKADAAAVLGSSLAAGSAETAEEDSSGFKRNQEISLSQAAPSQRQGVSELRRRNAGSDSRGLTSVKELLDECTVDTHHELQQVLRSHVYVGMADERRALLQVRTSRGRPKPLHADSPSPSTPPTSPSTRQSSIWST